MRTISLTDLPGKRKELEEKGFAIFPPLYTNEEIKKILALVADADPARPSFRRSAGLFAIRQLVKEIPRIWEYIYRPGFASLVNGLFGEGYFLVKSIYFVKPADSNWFVPFHQDLSIAVDRKEQLEGYGPWTSRESGIAVQPPASLLEDNFTVRIHLDETDESNGALRVVPGSHRKGVYRPETVDWESESEALCPVEAGGLMIMRPLLLHASGRNRSNKKRRVIHLECSRQALPAPLQWAEAAPRL